MKKLNNNGYMLVEIILAFVLAIGITYFVTELIIKLKNKNDDLLVKTLVSTDQTIIYNTIMEDIYKGYFSCDKINLDGNTFIYEGETIVVVSEYASIGNLVCDDTTDETRIHIPINVKQIPDDNFDVKIGIGDGIEGNSTLSCSLEMTSDNVVKLSDDFSFSGRIIYQGFDSNYEGDNSTSKTISETGTYTYYIKAKSGLNDVYGSCGIDVVNMQAIVSCPEGTRGDPNSQCWYTTDSASTNYYCYCYEATNGNMVAQGSSSSIEGCRSWCRGQVGSGNITLGTEKYYTCSSGTVYPLAGGGANCKHTTSNRLTTYSCPDGYTKANNSYCWK